MNNRERELRNAIESLLHIAKTGIVSLGAIRHAERLLAAKPTADDQPYPADRVPMPKNEAQAELMAKLGTRWLEQNAPHRLVQAGDQARRDAERLDWLETAQQTVYRYEEQVRLPKTDGSNEYEIRLEFRGWCVTGNDGEYFDTPRDAIDAAQAASAADGGSDE